MNQKMLDDLFAMQDLKYKNFQQKLIPNIKEEQVIGVRIPDLRNYVKTLRDQEMIRSFMNCLPHTYYEENHVHGFLIERIRSYDQCVEALEQFLPYVDNWATCDSMSPKILRTEPDKLLKQAILWMNRPEEYTVRFGIKVMMDVFLDENFEESYLYLIAKIQREEYYVKMMQSWYFATALAKQYESTIKLFENDQLELWVHNKSIQKAIESRRITTAQKDILRSMKR